jgi:hypothetical protein
MAQESADDFLRDCAGESYSAAKFVRIGDQVVGRIMTEPRPVERKSLKDGSPERQLPINLQTDEGPMTLWVRRGYMASAISNAVFQAGASGLQVGGRLTVTFCEERDTGKPNKAKVFTAAYEAPPASPVTVEDVFGEVF